jgi:D-alanyl-D-alanine carboxypeptidase
MQAAGAANAQTLEVQMQRLMDDFHAEYGFAGATAAITLPQGTTASAATGLADVEADTPMVPETRMLTASIGKSFVAATVLSLEADGTLAGTDLVSAHLGQHDWFERLPNYASMTVDDLLRHSAGLPDHVYDEAFQAELASRAATGKDAMAPVDAIGFILDQEPLFPSGTSWSYSDTGYLLLGLIIEEATGQRYYDLVTARFLRPLALDATEPSNTRVIDGMAVGYTLADNPFGLPPRTMDANGRLLWDPAMEWTGGGLVSTSGDLARWGHALFNGAAMDGPYAETMLDGILVSSDAPGILYGTGVAIYADTPRGAVYGHGGWVPGYVSSLRHYAGHGVTVAFQINTDVGIADDSTNLVPALEAALADLAIEAVQ